MVAVSLATFVTTVNFRETEQLTVDEAINLVGGDLTTAERKLIAAALRRSALAAVRGLKALALVNDSASNEAINGLTQLREALK